MRNERQQVRAERYAAIGGLQAEGMAARQIAREVGMSQRAVERWLTARGEPKHRRPPVLSVIDPLHPYLDRRQYEGCHSAKQLWREIVTDCYRSNFATLARWDAPLSRAAPVDGPVAAVFL